MLEWTLGWRMIETAGKNWELAKKIKHGLQAVRGIRRVFLILLSFSPILPGFPLLAQKPAARIDARLNTVPFDRQLWGIALLDQNGRLVYGRNESRLFIPASNIKLIVSAVASALLPPDWRVKTSVYGGPVVGGVLQGDLVLYGRGDPTMDKRCYAADSTLAGVCDV